MLSRLRCDYEPLVSENFPRVNVCRGCEPLVSENVLRVNVCRGYEPLVSENVPRESGFRYGCLRRLLYIEQ